MAFGKLKKIFNNANKIDVSKPLKFEYVSPEDYNGDVFEAIDAGRSISIITPYSDRYAGSDGTQHLPYNLRDVHDPDKAAKWQKKISTYFGKDAIDLDRSTRTNADLGKRYIHK